MTRERILVVDDEKAHRLMLKLHLEDAGFSVTEADSGLKALETVHSEDIDLILLDLKMPGMDGLEVLTRLEFEGTHIPVIIMTAYGSIETAVKALKLGAEDYLTKPLDTDELSLKLEKVLKLSGLKEIEDRQEEGLNTKFDFHDLKGKSPEMIKLKDTLALIAPSEATVLIYGASGTGKELVAKAIMKNSMRKDGPFVALNCAALAENLIESEMFGHEKGSFTGAHAKKAGRFEAADGGTLFLDEIGELPLLTQAKLLRVLEERTFERVGGTKSVSTDVRVLAATNKDLEEEIEAGRFREDLYYRINVVQVQVPDLIIRGPKEIIFLAEYFLDHFSKKNNKPLNGFRPQALKALTAHPWPGNVRELSNAVERAVVLSRGDNIELDDLPLAISRKGKVNTAKGGLAAGLTIKQVEAELIQRTLAENNDNRTRSAAMLGITRQTLLNKIKEYGL